MISLTGATASKGEKTEGVPDKKVYMYIYVYIYIYTTQGVS